MDFRLLVSVELWGEGIVWPESHHVDTLDGSVGPSWQAEGSDSRRNVK